MVWRIDNITINKHGKPGTWNVDRRVLNNFRINEQIRLNNNGNNGKYARGKGFCVDVCSVTILTDLYKFKPALDVYVETNLNVLYNRSDISLVIYEAKVSANYDNG